MGRWVEGARSYLVPRPISELVSLPLRTEYSLELALFDFSGLTAVDLYYRNPKVHRSRVRGKGARAIQTKR